MKKNKKYKKYFSAAEIKEIVLTENRLPKSINHHNIKHSFLAKTSGYIYGNLKNHYFE